LAVLSFLPGDDPIFCLNKAMAFISTVMDYSPTSAGETGLEFCWYGSKSNATSLVINRNGGNNESVQARVVRCYNCQGERYMARQCTQLKRLRNSTWFKEKILLVQAHEVGHVLDEEQLAFLADPGVTKRQDTQTTIIDNVAF
ncbi:hypothetical protein Tco_0182446, partial [Tanacetum coccineum]